MIFVMYYYAYISGLVDILMERGHVIAYTSRQLILHEENYDMNDLV